MRQTLTTIVRADRPSYDLAPFLNARPVDAPVRVDEDDDIIDAWLASVSVREFESFLNRLADYPAGASSALGPPA